MSGPVIQLDAWAPCRPQRKSIHKRIDDLVVSRFDGKVDILLSKVHTRTHIPGQRRQTPRLETTHRYEHLEKIADDIPPYEVHLSTGSLIRNNCVCVLKPRSIIPGKSNERYTIRTRLGWGVVEARNHGNRDHEIEMTPGCHHIAT